jgi:hypothetical protein
VSNFDSLVFILPQVEHLIRKLFSLANNVTFESSSKAVFVEKFNCQRASVNEFYFTMNELLQFTIDNKPSEVNKLVNLIDNHMLVFILYELFDYMEGPRVRDHLSHGELDSEIQNDYFTNQLLFVSASLCVVGQQDLGLNKKFLMYSQHVYNNYEPNFHPISCLKFNAFKLIES